MPVTVKSLKNRKGKGVDVELSIDKLSYTRLDGDLLKLTYSVLPYVTAVEGDAIDWKGSDSISWKVRLSAPEVKTFVAARNQKAIQKRVEALRRAVEEKIKAVSPQA